MHQCRGIGISVRHQTQLGFSDFNVEKQVDFSVILSIL